MRSCAIRAKQFPEVQNRYLSLNKRRDHKKAIIAIAKLLTAIYNLKKNERYNSELYRKSDRPQRTMRFLYLPQIVVNLVS